METSKKIKTEGIDNIKHGNCNRKPKNAIPSETIEKIINLKKSYNYEKVNFKHFCELLNERENIKISYSCLYNIMINNVFASKNKHRNRIVHRIRKRKSSEGDLVQADGTPFDWFEDNVLYSIHGFIDDVT